MKDILNKIEDALALLFSLNLPWKYIVQE